MGAHLVGAVEMDEVPGAGDLTDGPLHARRHQGEHGVDVLRAQGGQVVFVQLRTGDVRERGGRLQLREPPPGDLPRDALVAVERGQEQPRLGVARPVGHRLERRLGLEERVPVAADPHLGVVDEDDPVALPVARVEVHDAVGGGLRRERDRAVRAHLRRRPGVGRRPAQRLPRGDGGHHRRRVVGRLRAGVPKDPLAVDDGLLRRVDRGGGADPDRVGRGHAGLPCWSAAMASDRSSRVASASTARPSGSVEGSPVTTTP